MRFSFRAAALSAVILSCCAAVAAADPSLASEADTGPTASYIEHAASGLSAENLGLNDLSDPSAAHAVRDRAAGRHSCGGAGLPRSRACFHHAGTR